MIKKIFFISLTVFLIILTVSTIKVALGESKTQECVLTTDYQKEVTNLENEKEQLKKEIDMLKNDLSTIEGETKKYPAGVLYVGVDIPEGRYRISDGSSNFFVYNSLDISEVNIILGSEETYGRVKEYLYKFSNGETVKAESSFNLTKVD